MKENKYGERIKGKMFKNKEEKKRGKYKILLRKGREEEHWGMIGEKCGDVNSFRALFRTINSVWLQCMNAHLACDRSIS